ncbi:MAG: 1-acyl-sn-glycerol-3-phosphate acyltransferase [Anaerolineae bacterium]|nr:1-acyl-sn-glycerol-3-phosphate acyltransferase [Anaerolineae bacterium]
MSVIRFVVNTTIKILIRICCRVHDASLEQVPERGPLITVSNHISFLEAPLLYTHLLPRKLSGFSKAEFWNKPVSRFLFDMWDAIPVHRGEPDLAALRRVLAMLKEGYIIAVAPEGTRSHDGQMQRARPGAVTMGLRSGAPFLPIAHYGGEKLKDNLRRLRRTDFHIAVGQPFYLDAGETKVTRTVRQDMIDEVMYRIAVLLPPEYRGYYSDLNAATTKYLRFADV